MTLTILSLEDEADVRDALERDLEQFWDKIRLEVAEDVDDAWAVIDEIGRRRGRACAGAVRPSPARKVGRGLPRGAHEGRAFRRDPHGAGHRPGGPVRHDPRGQPGGPGLLHRQAWNPEELRAVVRDQLTEYVLESGVNPLPYVSVLDACASWSNPLNP